MDTSSVRRPHGELKARAGLRGHLPAVAQAPAPAARRRGQAGAAIRVCLSAATLVMTASTSSTRGRPAAPLAWITGPCSSRLLLPATLGLGRPQRAALCRMVTRGAPEKGEVRNPWGRAGKPETRVMRQQEAEQVADARAKAWSQALRRVNRPSRAGKQEEAPEEEVSLTEDIKHFHERSGALLRQCGGRMNSLTFNYKWEQRYGESLVTFIARQRLTVAEMLKQSNAFWVVDMPGDQDDHMQIYILNEKNLRQENNRETLGDKLSMHGDSDAIKEWRSRRSQGASRLEALMVDEVSVDDLEDEGLVGVSVDGNSGSMAYPSTSRARRGDDTEEEEVTKQVSCIKLPSGLEEYDKLSPLLDALEPCLSGVDSRIGLRQMHMAWMPHCTCAQSSVLALQQLGRLRHQGKGRHVRRVEDQVKCFADVVQSGMATLGFMEIATVLQVIQNRSGYDTLLLFVANRIVQGGMDLVKEAQTCTPETVTMLVKALSPSGQRDKLLLRQLSNLLQLIPPERFTLGSLAVVMDSFLETNFKDPSLTRFTGAVLQQLQLAEASADDVAAMVAALSKAPVQDEVSFRRLSRAVQSMPDAAFTPSTTAVILEAFATAKLREVALFRKLSGVLLQHDATLFTSADISRVVTAAAAFGSDAKAAALMRHMDTALLACAKNQVSPQHIGIIAASYAEVGGPSNPQVLEWLSGAAMALEPWVLDPRDMALIVKAFSILHEWDTALFARMSTILQQVDVSKFDLRSVATIVQAYVHEEVRDKVLLSKLATVLQQMDSSIFSSPEAVQEVSVILNAYAGSKMNDVALVLSQTLTNHLKPYIGGVTAQAMLNIIRRGVRSTPRQDRYVGGVREALERSRLDDDLSFSGVGTMEESRMLESRLYQDDVDDSNLYSSAGPERGGARGQAATRSLQEESFDLPELDDDIDLNTPPRNGLGRALVPFSQDYKGSSASASTKKRRSRAAQPIPMGWS